MNYFRLSLSVAILFLLLACSDDETNGGVVQRKVIVSSSARVNPTGYAPLTALASVTMNESAGLEFSVLGQRGSASTVTRRLEATGTDFEFSVLGLYADVANKVEIRALDSSGNVIDRDTLTITTAPLLVDLPQITIDVPSDANEPVFNLVNYFGFNSSPRPQRAFIFDQFGDIRWYVDYANHPILSDLFYDNGMTQMRNGNFFFGDGATGSIYEIDLLGNIVNSWSLQGNGFHHHVIEKPNENFLITINDASKTTIEDVVIEMDRNTGEIMNTWDFNESLDNARQSWPTDLADLNVDWFHANAIEYSEADESIIVSGRTQGIVKVNANNEVTYIVAPHRGWSAAGNGQDLNQFLLTPLDAEGNEITDTDVLDGTTNHPDFEWAWYQHSPILMPNGNLMVFDNGDNRNYTGFGPYSRAVEYEIDEVNKTIKQVWSYGKERGEETYARIVSKVSYIDTNNSILFTPGSSLSNGNGAGKVVEVDYDTKNVLFEATIRPPNTLFIITFHNVLRVSLYD